MKCRLKINFVTIPRILVSIIFLISFSESQNLDSDKEYIRERVLADNKDIDLARVKGRELTEDDFDSWKEGNFDIKSSEYYSAKSGFFATREEAKQNALNELVSLIRADLLISSKHSKEEHRFDNKYSISENYSKTIIINHKESLSDISIVYQLDSDESISAFILKHKLEYDSDVSNGLEKINEEGRNYWNKFELEKNGGYYTNAFKHLCNGYHRLESHIYTNSNKENLLDDFKNALREFIQKIKLERKWTSSDDKKVFFPFKEYEDFIHMQFKYDGKVLKNFPLILKCDNCLVDGWENLITKNETTDNNSVLNVDIESFLTTSTGQRIDIYPDVFPINNDDNKFSFNMDERKKEFNVSDKIIFGEVKISNLTREGIDTIAVEGIVVDECNNESEKYKYESISQSQDNWVIEKSEENVLELELNKKRNVYLVNLIYRISGSVRASVEEEFSPPLSSIYKSEVIASLIKDLYDDYDRENNFVKVKLSLAEDTILKILSPHYNNNLTERTDEIIGSNREITLRRGQKYSFEFFYNNSLGEQLFYTTDGTFTKPGQTIHDPLNGDFRFPITTLKMPITLKGINNYSLSIYSSKNIIPLVGWKLEKTFHKSDDREQSVEVGNDKKYKVILLKNGYKEYIYEDDASASNTLMFFGLNEYNKNSMTVPPIKIEKNNLQRPISYDYMKYLSIPGIGQREIMHNSKFNWRQFESYILIASTCYLGWEFRKAYSAYYESKDDFYDLQSDYALLTESQILEGLVGPEKLLAAGNMYNSMEKNHNDLKSAGNTLIALYIFNFADLVFSINFIK